MSYWNLLNKAQRRTWPYGTRIKVAVELVEEASNSLTPRIAVFIALEGAEGFVAISTEHDRVPVAGEQGTIEFREGGPTGGYWALIKEEA